MEKLRAEVGPRIGIASSSGAQDGRALTAVFGGLSALNTFEDTSNWVRSEIQKLNLVNPVDMFTKDPDNNFKGMLFAKFSTTKERDDVVQGFKTISMDREQSQWVKPDLPASIRAPQSFLFGMKRMLVDWSFEKSSIVRVEPDTNILSIRGERVLQVSVYIHMM